MAVKPSGPTQPPIDPRSYLANLVRLIRTLADLFHFAPIAVYFWVYWSHKEALRRGVRTAALTCLTISILFLGAGIVVRHTDYRSDMLTSSNYSLTAIIVSAACIGILIFHHRKELRHRHAEFVLVARLWEFLMRRGTHSWDDCIATAIRLFRDIFARFGIAHVSVAMPVNGELVINPKHVFPKETAKSFYERLPLDDGVGGSVYDDGNPRYVPRLFFPINGVRQHSLQTFCPHALMFEIRKDSNGRIDVVQPKLQFNVFKTSAGEPFVFKSFVSVPLKARGQSKCLGVLNFDFMTTDPLIRVDIKTAVVLGLILADELERIRPSSPAFTA